MEITLNKLGNLEIQLDLVEELFNDRPNSVKKYLTLSYDERGKILGLIDSLAQHESKYITLGDKLTGKNGLSFVYDNCMVETLFPQVDRTISSNKAHLGNVSSAYYNC